MYLCFMVISMVMTIPLEKPVKLTMPINLPIISLHLRIYHKSVILKGGGDGGGVGQITWGPTFSLRNVRKIVHYSNNSAKYQS